MSQFPPSNKSSYELYQEKKGREDLDSFWNRDWSRASSTTSSSTTRHASSYDIWLSNQNSVWIEERSRLLRVDTPFAVAPSAPIVSPPEKVSVGKRLKSFIKGFRNAIPDID